MGGSNDLNGLAGPTSNTKKNAVTMNMVTKAQPKSASSTRSRNFTTVATTYPVRTSAHKMIEPSSADHSVAKL